MKMKGFEFERWSGIEGGTVECESRVYCVTSWRLCIETCVECNLRVITFECNVSLRGGFASRLVSSAIPSSFNQ